MAANAFFEHLGLVGGFLLVAWHDLTQRRTSLASVAGSTRASAEMSETAIAKSSDDFYLDDLRVGQRFASKTHVIDEKQIKAFAREFDPQPFHLDQETAKHTLFAGLAASGWHTAATTMRLLVERGLPLAGGIIGTGGEISWPKPTRPGDTLAVTSEVVEIAPSRSRTDRGTVTVRTETRNQHGEVVQILLARLIVPRRVASRAAE
jgi:acyl dehydratase